MERKQMILFVLLSAWLGITIFQSFHIGKLESRMILYEAKIKDNDRDLKYCLSEIKKLVMREYNDSN